MRLRKVLRRMGPPSGAVKIRLSGSGRVVGEVLGRWPRAAILVATQLVGRLAVFGWPKRRWPRTSAEGPFDPDDPTVGLVVVYVEGDEFPECDSPCMRR